MLFAEDLILSNPVFSQKDRYFLTDDEQYSRAMEKFVESVKLENKVDLDQWDEYYVRR